MGIVVILVVLCTSVWVLIDAKSIGVSKGQIEGMGNMGPWGWFFACLGLWIISFPLYLVKRGEFKAINQNTEEPEKELSSAPETGDSTTPEQTSTSKEENNEGGCLGCFFVINLLFAGAGYFLYRFASTTGGAIDTPEKALGLVVVLIVGANLYLIPTYVAYGRNHKNKEAIFAVNLIFGGTLIGWGVAMIWSLANFD